MPFWDMYYHVVWATHGRAHLITPKVEEKLYGVIRHKSQLLKCPVLAINGMPDHIHVVVSIHPTVSVAQWVKEVKGFSSYQTNQLDVADGYFNWQSGYSSLTYGRKVIPQIVEYVDNQKQRHANDDVYQYLERTNTDDA